MMRTLRPIVASFSLIVDCEAKIEGARTTLVPPLPEGPRLRKTPEDRRPDKIIFVIITDGEENSSKEFHGDQVAAMIKEQTEKYSWNFVFMGANIDAYKAGSRLGIQQQNIAQYSTARDSHVSIALHVPYG